MNKIKKNTFLLLLVLSGFTVQAQNPTRFKDSYGKWGLKNAAKEIILEPKYNSISLSFPEGLAKVGIGSMNDRLYGFIDTAGREIIAPIYNDANDFSERVAVISLNGKYGYIDKTGKQIIPPTYDYAFDFSEGAAQVILDKKFGHVSKTGKVIIPIIYQSAREFKEGLAPVKINDKWGFINKANKMMIAPTFKDASSFSLDRAKVQLFDKNEANGNGKFIFIDKTGKQAIPGQYSIAGNFQKETGLARVEVDGKYGFINRMGKQVIPCQYDNVSDFQEEVGLARVELNDKYGFIDKSGKAVIPVENEYTDPRFTYGRVKVIRNGRTIIIDNTGKELN